MNRKLVIALRRCFSEQGFAIPIAIGMGLIMLLVGVTMIVRSQGDEVTASAQKGTADSLGVAETGVTRVLALLQKYPGLAPKNGATSWTAVIAATVNSSASCNGLIPPPPVVTSLDQAMITAIAAGNWIDVDSTDLLKGEFKVSSYTVAGTVSTLAVEGRARSNSGATTTTINNATTSLVVKFPLTFAKPPVPAIWLDGTSSSAIDVSNPNSIQASVLMLRASVIGYDSSKMGSSKFVAPNPGYTFTAAPAPPFPPLPIMPALTTAGGTVNKITMVISTGTLTLPRLGTDTVSVDGIYRYLINSDLTINGTGAVEITPGKKVIFYLDKNISVSGTGSLNRNGNPQDLEVYGSAASRDYGDGTSDLTTDVYFGEGTINNAFIYAPDALTTISQGRLNGAVWSDRFTSSSTSGSPIALSQACVNPTQVNIAPVGPPPANTTARIGAIQSWSRGEAP